MWNLFVRVVCERERVWRLKAIEDYKCFRRYLASKLPTKWSMCSAHDWNAKSQDSLVTVGFRDCLMGKAFLWDTRKTFCFAELSFLIHIICTHTIYTHITHRCWGVLLRENPSHKPWELEIVIPTILYIIHCGFPQLLSLHFHTLERLIAQTLTTPSQSVKWGLGAAGKHWKKPSFGGCNRTYHGIQKARQDTVSRSHVLVGAWRA